MFRLVEVRALSGYRLYVRFSDGVEGEADLSDLVGKGVFEAWRDTRFFERAQVGPGRQLRWDDEIEVCPDALYMRVTGKRPEEVFPELMREGTHA